MEKNLERRSHQSIGTKRAVYNINEQMFHANLTIQLSATYGRHNWRM